MVLKLTPPLSPSPRLYDCTLQLPSHTHADLSTFAPLWWRISLQIHIHGEFICLFVNLTITTILNTTKFVCSTLTATKLQSDVFKTSPLLLNSSHKISYYPVFCCLFQLCQFLLLFTALIVFLLLWQHIHLTNICWIITACQTLLERLGIQQLTRLIRSTR